MTPADMLHVLTLINALGYASVILLALGLTFTE